MANSKGKRGEYQVRDLLTAWWQRFEPDASFVRTPLSGGWHASGEFDVAGDLLTTSSRFPFSVEVKWREAWALKNVLEGRPSPVWGWWQQCVRDAEKTDRVPMLFFKRSRGPWMILLPQTFEVPIEPDVVWSGTCMWTFHKFEKCWPRLFLAKRFLETDPSLFARGDA